MSAFRGKADIACCFDERQVPKADLAAFPKAPMRGTYINPLHCFSFHPAVNGASAWKEKRMNTIMADYREFKIAPVGRYCDRLPVILFARMHLKSDAPAGIVENYGRGIADGI